MSLFQFPETRQYGSHMVMTNVTPDTKYKYVNIDTRFSDDFNTVGSANYNIVMPDKLTNVKSMSVVNVELPMSFYNISSAIGNNVFYVTGVIGGIVEVLLPDNQYSLSTLRDTIRGILNTAFSGDLLYDIDLSGNSVFTSGGLDIYTIDFNVDSSGDTKLTPKFKLGWMLGFRGLSYLIGVGSGSGETFMSEFTVNLCGPRYVYLVANEFHNGDQTSFISVLSDSTIRKNILARVTTDYSMYPYGTILPANFGNGFLTTDTRVYSGGKIDIQKLNIQIVDENGAVMNLNGEDVSICLLLELA